MSWFCPRCGHDASAAGTCPHDGEPFARVAAHDLVGHRLGEYKILAALGGGSFGAVYRGVHERSGMVAAIKILHRSIDDADSKRVLVEARAAAMIQHPNVVQVYDLALTADRRPYIVMQLLEGKPLAHLLAEPLPVAFAVSITRDVLAALDVAHLRGVIHRDLKPDNIFISKGRAIIVDFGLAKLVADPRAPSLTVTGEALGTPHYMAPEQVRGELADGRVDLYATGCVLFEMLAGRPPFGGPDAANATFAIFDAHLHTPPPSISLLRSDVPPIVETAIARALAKDLGSRFASAREMLRALAGDPPRKRRWPIAVGVALGAALVTAVIVGAIVGSGSSADRGAGSGSSASSDPPIAEPRAVVVPPARPGDPPLDPNLEDSLGLYAKNLGAGIYKRADVVTLRCALEQAYRTPSIGAMHAFARRMVTMLHAYQPDLDPAVDCKQPPATRAPATRRIAMPEAQPDELPIDPNMEMAIATLHEQLELGHLTRTVARTMHCDFEREDRVQIRDTGSVPRQLRGLHRRINILLEGYHPGVTAAGCQ